MVFESNYVWYWKRLNANEIEANVGGKIYGTDWCFDLQEKILSHKKRTMNSLIVIVTHSMNRWPMACWKKYRLDLKSNFNWISKFFNLILTNQL